ncbi:MAG TPA: SMR family transporter [Gemmatimonadaceae bacterium]|nr:SMR family transporter [Gemmatimonadaceae bacterium]
MRSASISPPFTGYLYVLGCVLFTVYGQLILKWQVGRAGSLPVGFADKARYMIALVLMPWMLTSVIAAFLAFVCWAAAMTKLDLSYAYPFTSLSFVLVSVLSVAVFRETVPPTRVLGLALIVVGIIIGSRA